MKTAKFLTFISLLLAFTSVVNAKDYVETQYKFSIEVPDNWGVNTYMDGTDKIYDFLSPDENAFIQVRSFQAGAGLTMELLTQVFEQNYLPAGYQKQGLVERKSSNGIPGMQGTYIAQFNGQEVGISIFYVIQRGQGYTLMGIVPTSMINDANRQKEISGIMKSFIIPGYKRKTEAPKTQSGGLGGIAGKMNKENTQTESQSVPETKPSGGLLGSTQQTNQGQLSLKNLTMGDQMIGKTNLINQTTTFVPTTENIYIVFEWEGQAEGKELVVKWYYDESDFMITQSVYTFPANQGASNASISIPNTGWPLGDYHAEFSIDGQVVKEQAFVVVESIPETNESESLFDQTESSETSKSSAEEQASSLFAGSEIKAKSEVVVEEVEEDYHHEEYDSEDEHDYSEYKKSKNNQQIDGAYDYPAQVRYWAKEDDSDGEWKEWPLKSSSIIHSLSSEKTSWSCYATGKRKNTMYSPHVMDIDDNDTHAEKNSFNFILNNRNYATDQANDIICLDYKYNWICGNKGMIMFSANGTTSWYTMQTPTQENLKSISFANEKNGIAVGDNGTILITSDGGQHWEKIDSPVSGNLQAVEMTDANTAYILPFKTEYLKGYVLRTTDGGRTWVKKEFPSQFQTPVAMYSLSFMGKDEIWICGTHGLLFKSNNGGDSWEYQESARGEYRLYDICMVTNDEGWACGTKGTLLHTTNGGDRWKKEDLGIDYDLYCLEFNGPYKGWVSSRYNLFHYNDEKFINYTGDFNQKFKIIPKRGQTIDSSYYEETIVIKAYQVYDFKERKIVPLPEFSTYGFYVFPYTDKIKVKGSVYETNYTNIYDYIDVDRFALTRKYSNQYNTLPLNKVCVSDGYQLTKDIKLILLNQEIITEYGEQIPQLTIKIINDGEKVGGASY